MPKATPSLFQNCEPENVAVVLASSVGSRLFPVTSSQLPKHMLPVAGIPVISRLMTAIQNCGFQECVVLLSHDDKVTIPYLKSEFVKDDKDKEGSKKSYQVVSTSKPNVMVLESEDAMQITVLTLDEDCQGSIDALRKVEETAVVPASSNMVVIPGDLVVFDTSVFSRLCDTHRQGYQGLPNGAKSVKMMSACTVLLTDVGEQDEHGVPLKESAKVRFAYQCEESMCVFVMFVF